MNAISIARLTIDVAFKSTSCAGLARHCVRAARCLAKNFLSYAGFSLDGFSKKTCLVLNVRCVANLPLEKNSINHMIF